MTTDQPRGYAAAALEALERAESCEEDGFERAANREIEVANVYARLAQAEQLRRIADALTVTPSDPGAEFPHITDPEERQIRAMPAPKGYVCPACGHSTAAHRMHGCDVGDCDCGAPYGRILPGDPAPDA